MNEPERGPTPPEIRQDRTYIARNFLELTPLRNPPSWLTARLLRRALGPRPSTDLREELEQQLEKARTGAADRLRWGLIDPVRGRYVLGYRLGLEACGLVVIDARGAGRPIRTEGRGDTVFLKDVAGDATPEIIVPLVVGNWVSVYPTVWEVYTVTRGKRLARIATVPKQYSWGSKWERYCFLNQIRFPRKDLMQVETVLLRDEHCAEEGSRAVQIPPRLNERREFQYRPRQRKFVPTAR